MKIKIKLEAIHFLPVKNQTDIIPVPIRNPIMSMILILNFP